MAKAKADKSIVEEVVEKVTDVAETVVEKVTEVVETAAEAVADRVEEVEATAKAGKRSAKAIKETEEKIAKEERKASDAEAEDKPKQHQNPTRPRLERQGKNFRKAAELVEKDKMHTVKEALELATKTNPAKFDATVELHINLNVDPRHADQNIRDNLVLPAGTGKVIRVAVLADEHTEGADIAGVETVLKELEKGQINFDILIATPQNMPKLGKYARTLGPRGLMPNPKSGTVTTDVAKAIKESKAGRVEFRVDSTGIVHLGIGKVSFGAEKLEENTRAVLNSIKAAKPASVKGTYVKAIHLTTTMGPSISVAASEL